MAITYIKKPPSDRLVGLNNSILNFTSNLTDQTHAIITNNQNNIQLKIYPSPSGEFWVNLKELYKTFFRFVDEVEISYGSGESVTFVDDDAFKVVGFTITVYNNAGSDTDFFKINLLRYAVQDLENYKTLNFQSISPLKYTYFKGYPFDVQFWIDNDVANGGVSRYPHLLTNLIINRGVNRVWCDVGNVGGAIFSVSKGAVTIYYENPKTVDCEGIYLKWLATDGSWRYWLFNQKHKDTLKTKSLGQLYNDWNEPKDSNNPIIEVGKTAERVKKLHANGLEKYERDNVATLLTSPKIFLYKGNKGEVATLSKFYEVELLTQTFNIEDYGRNSFNIDFEIKERVQTITLV